MGVVFMKQLGLSWEWKREGVMDEQSGESDEEEVMGEGIDESEMEELVPEWGQRRDREREFILETRWSITKGATIYF